jgi:hypothetical protein
LPAINQAVIDSLGSSVQSGPFCGLRLPEMTLAEHIGPYILGTYERELHPWWDELLARDFDFIVNVGAQFGYYAVGLARRYPHRTVVAFDSDWWARQATTRTGAANGVANLVTRGYCTPRWLAAHVQPRSLIVSDCEGFELELFCRRAIAPLKTATMIVELHEHIVPGVTDAFLDMFRATHTWRLVSSRADTSVSFQIDGLTSADVNRAASEVRCPQQWICLEPKRSS